MRGGALIAVSAGAIAFNLGACSPQAHTAPQTLPEVRIEAAPARADVAERPAEQPVEAAADAAAVAVATAPDAGAEAERSAPPQPEITFDRVRVVGFNAWAVRSALDHAQGPLRTCWRGATRQLGADAKATVRVSLRVQPGGRVMHAKIFGTHLPQDVDTCIVDALETITVPDDAANRGLVEARLAFGPTEDAP